MMIILIDLLMRHVSTRIDHLQVLKNVLRFLVVCFTYMTSAGDGVCSGLCCLMLPVRWVFLFGLCVVFSFM